MSGIMAAACCCGGGTYPNGDPNCPTLFVTGTKSVSLSANSAGYVVGAANVTGPFENGCPAQCQINYPDTPPVYETVYFRKCILFELDRLPVGNFPAKFVQQPVVNAPSIPPCVPQIPCPDFAGGKVQDITHPGGGVAGTWNLVVTPNGLSYTLTKTSETPNGPRLISWAIDLSGPSCAEWSTFWGNPGGLFPSWAVNKCPGGASTGKWHFWVMRMQITQQIEELPGMDCTDCGNLPYGTSGSDGWIVYAVYGRPVTPGFNPAVPYSLSGAYSLLFSAAQIPNNTIFEQQACSTIIRDTSAIPAYDRVLAPPCNPPGVVECSTTQPRTGPFTANRIESCSSLAAGQYGFTIPNTLTVS